MTMEIRQYARTLGETNLCPQRCSSTTRIRRIGDTQGECTSCGREYTIHTDKRAHEWMISFRVVK